MRSKARESKATAKARSSVKGKTSRYDWKAAEQLAAKGQMPSPPDFSAPTHDLRALRG